MDRYNFHQKEYGWNYFIEIKGDKVRFGRYHTNGHINKSEEKTVWIDRKFAESEVDISYINEYISLKKQGLSINNLKRDCFIECERGMDLFNKSRIKK